MAGDAHDRVGAPIRVFRPVAATAPPILTRLARSTVTPAMRRWPEDQTRAEGSTAMSGADGVAVFTHEVDQRTAPARLGRGARIEGLLTVSSNEPNVFGSPTVVRVVEYAQS